MTDTQAHADGMAVLAEAGLVTHCVRIAVETAEHAGDEEAGLSEDADAAAFKVLTAQTDGVIVRLGEGVFAIAVDGEDAPRLKRLRRALSRRIFGAVIEEAVSLDPIAAQDGVDALADLEGLLDEAAVSTEDTDVEADGAPDLDVGGDDTDGAPMATAQAPSGDVLRAVTEAGRKIKQITDDAGFAVGATARAADALERRMAAAFAQLDTRIAALENPVATETPAVDTTALDAVAARMEGAASDIAGSVSSLDEPLRAAAPQTVLDAFRDVLEWVRDQIETDDAPEQATPPAPMEPSVIEATVLEPQAVEAPDLSPLTDDVAALKSTIETILAHVEVIAARQANTEDAARDPALDQAIDKAEPFAADQDQFHRLLAGFRFVLKTLNGVAEDGAETLVQLKQSVADLTAIDPGSQNAASDAPTPDLSVLTAALDELRGDIRALADDRDAAGRAELDGALSAAPDWSADRDGMTRVQAAFRFVLRDLSDAVEAVHAAAETVSQSAEGAASAPAPAPVDTYQPPADLPAFEPEQVSILRVLTGFRTILRRLSDTADTFDAVAGRMTEHAAPTVLAPPTSIEAQAITAAAPRFAGERTAFEHLLVGYRTVLRSLNDAVVRLSDADGADQSVAVAVAEALADAERRRDAVLDDLRAQLQDNAAAQVALTRAVSSRSQSPDASGAVSQLSIRLAVLHDDLTGRFADLAERVDAQSVGTAHDSLLSASQEAAQIMAQFLDIAAGLSRALERRDEPGEDDPSPVRRRA